MDALGHLRHMIAALDATLVEALCRRARYGHHAEAYSLREAGGGDLSDVAGAFAHAETLAGRVRALRAAYVRVILPAICRPGVADEAGGWRSADQACLDALARRLTQSVHVASRKLESLPADLQTAIRTGEADGVEAAITFPQVEEEVLRRVREQAAGLAPGEDIPDRLATLYSNWIIPVSRRIQVHGLLGAAGRPPTPADRGPEPERNGL